MIDFKVYIKGAGLRGKDDVVFAVRDEKPNVKSNNYYTIKRIVDEGACGSRNLMIELKEVEGFYSHKTFRTSPRNK